MVLAIKVAFQQVIEGFANPASRDAPSRNDACDRECHA